MPHFPHTPEALLGRNDSKNPNATCKGITSTGRACRRALASPKSPPVGKRTCDPLAGGVVAVVRDGGQEADFYCWQHKGQALDSVDQAPSPGNSNNKRKDQRSPGLPTLQERSSIDTLVQRLGIDSTSAPNKSTSNPKPPRKTNTNDFAVKQSFRSLAPHAEKYNFDQRASRRPQSKKKGFWASLCCMTAGDDDYVEIVRHKKRTEQDRPQMSATARPSASSTRPTTVSSDEPLQRLSSNPETNGILSLIPQSLPPQTTSALLAELVKPISPYDEDGYIYIFWLTPSSATPPGDTTAKSLLAPRDSRPHHAGRISDVMTEFSFDGVDDDQPRGSSEGESKATKKTIMLKIGRANNITRRMNEWLRQCGYALNLVRWYPYVSSSSPQPSPQQQKPQPLYPDLSKPPSNPRRESENVHKCPHVHRVERLIHLELASKQVKRQCETCGKEHREWFEVEATQDGVKAVDETVRRWIGWAERQAT